MCDVDAETRDTAVEPEAENPVELLAHVLVPPVEVRLLGREVVQVVAAALAIPGPRGAAAERGEPVVRDPVLPHVEPGPFAEPRVAVGGVVRDEVEQDADPALTRLAH